jgi:hypothetical protein
LVASGGEALRLFVNLVRGDLEGEVPGDTPEVSYQFVRVIKKKELYLSDEGFLEGVFASQETYNTRICHQFEDVLLSSYKDISSHVSSGKVKLYLL